MCVSRDSYQSNSFVSPSSQAAEFMKLQHGQSFGGGQVTGALDVLVIGVGYAGKRFIDVIRYMQQDTPSSVRLTGVVDRDAAALAAAEVMAPHFADLGEALRSAKPSAVVVCVNEQHHCDVLSQVCAAGVPVILCEKPLTATTKEAELLESTLCQRFVSVNLVERFSPVVEACRQWLSAHPDQRVRRIEFFWGKHRVRDPRPTIGACSELIHPIDLVRHIFDTRALRVRSAFGLISDIQPVGEEVLDSVSVMMTSGDVAIVGQSSFAWSSRDRRIVAYAGNAKALHRLMLQFDSPHWDCDRLTISRIDKATGIYEDVFEYVVSNADFPPTLKGIYKVSRYVRASFAAASGKPDGALLVGVTEAIELQRILDDVARAGTFEHVRLCHERCV
jgi:predicted dehydrogenase